MPRSDLEQALTLHRSGQLEEAVRIYVSVLEKDPEDVEAMQLLGAAMNALGHHEEAVAILDRALGLDKRHPAALLNRGKALATLGRHDEGIASVRKANRIEPTASGWTILATLLREADRWEEVVPAARKAIGAGAGEAAHALIAIARDRQGAPEEAEATARTAGVGALADLATDRRDRGDLDGAARLYQEALDRNQAIPELHAYLGATWYDLGKIDGARTRLEAAVKLGAMPPWVWGILGDLRLKAGELDAAVTALTRGLAAGPEMWPAWADAVGQLSSLPEGVPLTVLVTAFQRRELDPQRLERVTRAVIASSGSPPEEHPLFVPWLSRTIVADPDWEDRLVALRDRWLSEPGPHAAMAALALQAWHTEYAWPVAEMAAPAVAPEHLEALLQYAMTAPLHTLEGASLLLAPTWRDTALWPLINAQLVQLARETMLAQTIESFADSNDPTSARVRAQYEENPYPRLVTIQRRTPRPVPDWLRDRYPGEDVDLPVPTRVLVAGGGTGQHPLTVASTFAEREILAIDLSRASLARAARVAQDLGIDDIRFAQADILGLNGQQTFDVIDSVGVLHHLDDPDAGLSALLSCLAPHGWLRLGLYSERAREDVVAAHSILEGTDTDPDSLRAARQTLRALPDDHPARTLVHSIDFYSLSGFRDLVLHVCEHRYTLPGIGALLERHGLRLVGFQHPRSDAMARYGRRFPDDESATDLANWAVLEEEDPRLFTGMYVFWATRR